MTLRDVRARARHRHIRADILLWDHDSTIILPRLRSLDFHDILVTRQVLELFWDERTGYV